MTRLELIINQSLKEDILAILDRKSGLLYSIIPTVHGRGEEGWTLGTMVWPETCFLLLLYLPTSGVDDIIQDLAPIKLKYGSEGMVCFCLEGAKKIILSDAPWKENGSSQ